MKDIAKLTVTHGQLHLIQRALDFYSRIGIGQFEEIKNHPTFIAHLHKEFTLGGGEVVKKWTGIDEIQHSTDYTKYRKVRDEVDDILVQARNMLYNNNSLGKNGSWGINNPNVDESCIEAFDLIKVIRHEFWKKNPKRSSITVDSSVHLRGKDSNQIKVEL